MNLAIRPGDREGRFRAALLLACVLLAAVSSDARAATGGPDGFGYTWRDGAEPGVVFAWEDISVTGTDITVEASMSEEEAARIAAAADEHGKADYDLVMELKDTDGNVVAISTNRYQMRSHGI